MLNASDSQTNTLQLAAQHVDFAVTSVDSAEAALNTFVELQPEIVIIDSRHLASISDSSVNSKNGKTNLITHSSGEGTSLVGSANFDPLQLCK